MTLFAGIERLDGATEIINTAPKCSEVMLERT
jgi:hypothetical protein